MTAYSDSNVFDKFCDIWPDNIKMEQIAVLALMSKVIHSYKIGLLKSFHDDFMEGLWKRSPDGCFYPLDKRHERVLYVEINENYDYEAELEKSKEKFRNFGAKKVFDKMPTSVFSTNEVQDPISNDNQGDGVGEHEETRYEQDDSRVYAGHVVDEKLEPNPSSPKETTITPG